MKASSTYRLKFRKQPGGTILQNWVANEGSQKNNTHQIRQKVAS